MQYYVILCNTKNSINGVYLRVKPSEGLCVAFFMSAFITKVMFVPQGNAKCIDINYTA